MSRGGRWLKQNSGVHCEAPLWCATSDSGERTAGSGAGGQPASQGSRSRRTRDAESKRTAPIAIVIAAHRLGMAGTALTVLLDRAAESTSGLVPRSARSLIWRGRRQGDREGRYRLQTRSGGHFQPYELRSGAGGPSRRVPRGSSGRRKRLGRLTDLKGIGAVIEARRCSRRRLTLSSEPGTDRRGARGERFRCLEMSS